MRRLVALGVLGLLLVPGLAHATTPLTLAASRPTVAWGAKVTFSGRLDPAAADRRVHLYRDGVKVGETVARVGGGWKIRFVLHRPGVFVARANTGSVVSSAPVTVRLRPVLTAGFRGSAWLGRRLVLVGRLVPLKAGRLRLTVAGRTRRVHLTPHGRFRVRMPTGSARTVRARLRLAPAENYLAVGKRRRRGIKLPTLGIGSRGPGVRALERQLRAQHYALRSVSSRYTLATAEAVYAFQKVHGLSRTGRATPYVLRRLARSHVPRAQITHGSHIEISKTLQVIYEVRHGKVVNVLHTSTGATGNTPVGRFHVYWKDAGFNALGMYYSLYFHGGFAIHGYHSVPPWPASHGCARIPLWAAPGLFGRWGVGTMVRVYP